MATTTTNLNLVKPDYDDTADIDVLNTNMDTIDTEVAKRSVGAASSTNNGIALFDGAGGKTLKDSGKTITDESSATAMANDTNVPTNRTVRNAIYNGLDKSSGAGFALDARQGYSLNQNKVSTSDVKNNLTTTSAGYVLDARQGKALKDSIPTSAGYHTLMENATTSSYVSRNLMNSRKFSDYDILFFEFYRESWMVGSAIITRSQFASSTGIAVVTYWNSIKIEFDAKYVSDTSISVKEISDDSAGTNHYMRVRAIKLE